MVVACSLEKALPNSAVASRGPDQYEAGLTANSSNSADSAAAAAAASRSLENLYLACW